MSHEQEIWLCEPREYDGVWYACDRAVLFRDPRWHKEDRCLGGFLSREILLLCYEFLGSPTA
jgi:hypothetical protein